MPLLFQCREKEEWKLRAVLIILLYWDGCKMVSCNFVKETIPIDIAKCCGFVKAIKSYSVISLLTTFLLLICKHPVTL